MKITTENILLPYLIADMSQILVTEVFMTEVCRKASIRYYTEPYKLHLHKFFKELFTSFTQSHQELLLQRMDDFEDQVKEDLEKLITEIFTVLKDLNTNSELSDTYLLIIAKLHCNSVLLQVAKSYFKKLNLKSNRINEMLNYNTLILNHLPINITADLNQFKTVTTQLEILVNKIINYKIEIR